MTCALCNEPKPLAEGYSVNGRRRDGTPRYSRRCKACTSRIHSERQYARQWRERNPEKYAQVQQRGQAKYRKKITPERRRAYSQTYNARLKERMAADPELAAREQARRQANKARWKARQASS
jgi:hypothetical protein